MKISIKKITDLLEAGCTNEALEALEALAGKERATAESFVTTFLATD